MASMTALPELVLYLIALALPVTLLTLYAVVRWRYLRSVRYYLLKRIVHHRRRV